MLRRFGAAISASVLGMIHAVVEGLTSLNKIIRQKLVLLWLYGRPHLILMGVVVSYPTVHSMDGIVGTAFTYALMFLGPMCVSWLYLERVERETDDRVKQFDRSLNPDFVVLGERDRRRINSSLNQADEVLSNVMADADVQAIRDAIDEVQDHTGTWTSRAQYTEERR